ncbi:MAG: RraA family protein, partial [Rhodobiaceae bacterium]
VDTPTVCNAIEVAQGKRGFNRFTRGTMHHCKPGDPAIVGFARTAKISGLAPPNEAPEVIRARRMEYFHAMAGGTSPTAAVVEDVDYPNCIAGWWGEVHVAVHKGLGLAGAVTNGAQGELIHADRHGALVIPEDVIPELKAAIDKVIACEAIVLGPARQPGFDINKLEEAWAKFEAART